MGPTKRSLTFAALGVIAISASTSVLATVPGVTDSPGTCSLVPRASAKALLSVPFRIVDGRIYVEVRVDGEGPFTFAVDTGASGMARADASLVSRLGLAVTGFGETSDAVVTGQADKVRLTTLDLGGMIRRDLEVMTRDYSAHMSPEAPFSGILGRDFFADGLLVIDYPRRRLTFTRSAGLARGGPDVLPYRRAFRVPVTIGAVTTQGQLDTGANIAFVLPRPLFDRVGGGPVETAGDGKLTNTTIRTGSAKLRGPIRIGAASLSDIKVRVSDDYPELLVGARALQHFALLIDQRSSAVALCPPQAE